MNFDTEQMIDGPAHASEIFWGYLVCFVVAMVGQWLRYRAPNKWMPWGNFLVRASSFFIVIYVYAVPTYGVWEWRLSRWVLGTFSTAMALVFFFTLKFIRRGWSTDAVRVKHDLGDARRAG